MKKSPVCVDLDGTLAKYEKWQGIEHFGEPIKGAKEFLEKLSKIAHIIIYTCRLNYEFNDLDTKEKQQYGKKLVENWLKKNDLMYDEIWCGQGKPIANSYVDDRSVTCRPLKYTNPNIEYTLTLNEIEELL